MVKDGIINISKPQNMTSRDVVNIVRRTLGIRKTGHTGTLDPMATGVLPVCLGRATRIIEYLDMDFKTYRCTMVLGRHTDTGDVWGTEISRVPEEQVNQVTEQDVIRAFRPFRGVITQTPPIYSAIRVNGKRLYQYAREGQTVEIPTRQVFIRSLTLESVNLGQGYDSSVTFQCQCSKGTYIRSICQEAGEALGTGGAMSALTREASGFFSLEQSLDLPALESLSPSERDSHIVPPDAPLTSFGRIEIAGKDIWRMTNGLTVWRSHCRVTREPVYASRDFPLPVRDEFRRAYAVYASGQGWEDYSPGTFLGVAFMDPEGQNLHADKIFKTEGA